LSRAPIRAPVRAPLRAIVFDLDGTLVDSLGDIADAMNHALVQVGAPSHPLSAYHRFVGDGVDALVRRALGPERAGLHASALAAYRARYADHFADRTAPYPGVAALLAGVAARGLPMAVLSNKPDPATREVVARLLPDARFRVVRGERPGVPRKPDPAGALEVVAALGVAPGEALLLGDTDVDVRTALAAGLVPVGALWGFRDAAELRAAGCELLVERPEDVLRLIDVRNSPA
jgi:phosphoglycolate phosphatase